MVLLILRKNEWEVITKEEKAELPDEEKIKVLSLSKKLKDKLDFGLKQQSRDNDVVGVFVGDEGSGKSSLAGNVMRYISKDKFNPNEDMIGADYTDGIKKITNVKYGKYLMFDEGNSFFLATETMKKEHRNLHKIFSIFRQKNLFVLIVAPSFFRLGSYFASDRSDFLCRTRISKGKRGFFDYWGKKAKDKLYRFGKKEYNYGVVKPLFSSRFTRCSILENEEYKRFKLKTLNESIATTQEKKPKTPTEIKRELIREIIKNNPDEKAKHIGKIVGLKERRVYVIMKELENNRNAVGNNCL